MVYNKYSKTYRMKYGHKNIITSQKYVRSCLCGAVWSDRCWWADIGAGSGLMSMAVVGPVLAAGGRCCVAEGVVVVVAGGECGDGCLDGGGGGGGDGGVGW